MAILRSPVFIICLVLFIIHQVLQKGLYIPTNWPDKYLDNIVAIPIILTLLVAERMWLFKKGKSYRLSPAVVIVATLYIIFITEILFPMISNDFTGDWVDVFFYSAGSLLFYYTVNRLPERK